MRTKIQLTGIYLFLLCTLISCSGKNNLKPLDSSVDKGIYTHELINNKENCELPCFWGIQVGETTYEEVNPYLLSFAIDSYEPNKINDGSYSTSYGFFDSKEDIDFYIGFNIMDGIIRRLGISVIYEDHSYISISEIMQTYGVPTEVYIEAKMNMQQTWDTIIILFYENINVKFEYFASGQPELENENINSCFEGSPAITIWSAELWNKEQKITFYDLFPFLDENYPNKNQANLPEVFELKEVTDWTVEDFYLHFYNNNEFCVEIINR